MGGRGELQGVEADVVQGFIVDAKGRIGVFDQVIHGQGSVVRLDNGVRDLGRGNNRVGARDPVVILFADLREDEGSHAGASASSERVCHLKALEAVATFGFLANDIKHFVDKLGS